METNLYSYILTDFTVGVECHQGKDSEKKEQQTVRHELHQKEECRIFSQFEHNQTDDQWVRDKPVIVAVSLNRTRIMTTT